MLSIFASGASDLLALSPQLKGYIPVYTERGYTKYNVHMSKFIDLSVGRYLPI